MTLLILFGLQCGGGKTDEGMSEKVAQEYAEKMCAKMEECSNVMLQKIPAAMREQMRARMPSKETCLARAEKNRGKRSKKKLTSEQIDAIKKCMDDMVDTPCEKFSALQSSPNCRRASRLVK